MIGRLINQINGYIATIANIVTLKNLKPILNTKRKVKIMITHGLNILNSMLKILAPATFGKAIEMIAKSEETYEMMGFEWSSTALLYSSGLFTVWMLIENQLRRYIISELENEFIKNKSLRLVRASHKMALSEHVIKRSEMMNSFISIQNSGMQLPQELINTFIPSLFDILVGIGFIAVQFGEVPALAFLFYSGFNMFFYNHLLLLYANSSQQSDLVSSRLNDFISHEQEVLSLVKTVRMSNREAYEMQKSKRNLSQYIQARTAVARADLNYFLLNKLPQALATFILITRISTNVTIDDIDESIFLLTYFSLFAASVDTSMYSQKTLLNLMNNVEKMNALADSGNDYESVIKSITKSKIAVNSQHPAIEFCNVTFGYTKSNPLFKNINFSIPKGKKIAIVGKSGSGKSTLAELLLKYHPVNQGVIKFKGIDIATMSAESLRAKIGYVNQAPELFAKESLNYNLIYGDPGRRIAKGRTITPRVNKNYNTFESKTDRQKTSFANIMSKIGLAQLIARDEEPFVASSLSGGQKQQLNMGRILLKNPEVIICDEPTAALDSFSEAELLANFYKLMDGKTIIMIAHRLSTIKMMDEILVLGDGKVVERGTHQELLALNGEYCRYWELQSAERSAATSLNACHLSLRSTTAR